MNCPSETDLTDYVTKREAVDTVKIEEHLGNCSHCKTRIGKLRAFANSQVEQHGFHDERQFHDAMAAIRGIRLRAVLPESTPSESLVCDLSGTNLGEYRILQRVGQGGMGVVYKARHAELDRIVAVKTLPVSEGIEFDQADIKRFQNEIRAIAQLDHVNIVRAMDARQIDSVRFLAMEYVDGETLAAQVKRRGPLSICAACNAVLQAAKGLAHAHQHGIIHRDVKPHNLMSDVNGLVKVLDLGIALHSPKKVDRQVRTEVIGTFDYMSPEQIAGEGEIDERTDVYGLGCTFYFLLTGLAPFHDRDGELKKLLAQTGSEPKALSELRADCPEEVAAIAHKMMAKQPVNRFQSCEEIATVLSDWLSKSSDAPPIAQSQQAESVIRSDPRLSNRKLIWGLVGCAAVIVLAGVLVTIKTERGTLLVEADDSVKVVIQNESIRIQDLKTQRNYELRIGDQELPIGEYQIDVKSEELGIEFSTDDFTIKRDQRTSLRAVLATDDSEALPPKTESTTAYAPYTENVDQQVAEWALGIGVDALIVEDGDGDRREVRDTLGLPDPCRIISLDFGNLKTLTDEMLVRLDGLKYLTHLNLSDTSVTNAGLKHLQNLPALRYLDLSRLPAIDAAGLRELENVPSLRFLILWLNELSSEDLEQIARLQQIDELLISPIGLTDEDLKPLGKLVALKKLSLPQANLNGSFINHLTNGKLSYLEVASPQLTLDGWSNVEKLPSLFEVNIGASSVTNDYLKPLLAHDRLERLQLAWTAINDGAAEIFTKMDRLEHLYLRGTPITNAFLAEVPRMKNLSLLELWETSVTDAGIQHLEGLDRLKSIDLRGTKVTSRGVARLRLANPDCRVTSDFDGRPR